MYFLGHIRRLLSLHPANGLELCLRTCVTEMKKFLCFPWSKLPGGSKCCCYAIVLKLVILSVDLQSTSQGSGFHFSVGRTFTCCQERMQLKLLPDNLTASSCSLLEIIIALLPTWPWNGCLCNQGFGQTEMAIILSGKLSEQNTIL